MKHYQKTFSVHAAPADVYAALTSIASLRGWWTQDCDGDPAAGGTIHFRFGVCFKDMRVEQLVPASLVQWRCTAAHIEAPSITRSGEWVGTQVVFRLHDEEPGRTRIAFEHVGLLPSLECHALCTQGWEQFLGSLTQFLETGEGAPYQRSMPASTMTLERSAAV
jgi:uncharacterized protein YndB with AHSA1/START domain